MLDYDKEADAYDASRGGEARAHAATEALLDLIPEGPGRLLDVACGTGIVTRRLAARRPALRVTGADLATAMVRRAGARLPGAIVRADSRRLPFPTGGFDAVISIWLLHLLDDAEDARAVVAECARVLRPGGIYVTTVDKAAAHDVGSDIDSVLASRPRRPAQDAAATVTAHAARHGLEPAGATSFRGVGQGRSPRATIADLRRGWFTQLAPDGPRTEEFATRLAGLPDQDRPRPDPVFEVRAYRKPTTDRLPHLPCEPRKP
ncbi:methyltransferase domain-containing protein [Streptomyces broussonetiae]|uniref:Methyltransferase domain-containing protein n=1 Tax=Streptomyces broussonetiae TaxID=2686304 RepID=A0A6I6NBE6_9ACTN|nr:class I SAM-dependent methyltransferase [Streptomyces broussonetiae]QHA07781.1 methyltransferase domain-containing protein [Streptomyces broussonetiae]